MKRFGLGLLQSVGSGLRFLLIAVITVAVGTGVIAVANYAVTQGSGTNFASLVISTVHYAAMVICDATAGQSQCGTVKAGNTAAAGDIALVVSDPTSQALIAAPIPNCNASPCTTTIGNVYLTNQYPATATPYTATATGTTGATTATLAGASSVTTYLCGFSIRANATAAATGNATVTGVITATMNFTQWTAPNASGLGITEMIFAPCVPASGTNQSVAVVSAAPGTGGVVSVTAWGYKL